MGLFDFTTRVLAVVGVIAIIAAIFIFYPNVLPIAQNEWNKVQPPHCATASDCVLANNSCCSNSTGNWSCAGLEAHCAPNYEARVSGCWCGSGVCAANYSCEPLHPTATVELPPFPPEDLEVSVSPSLAAASPAAAECVANASDSSCCLNSVCMQGVINFLCIQGSEGAFQGCDENCTPKMGCVPIPSPIVSP